MMMPRNVATDEVGRSPGDLYGASVHRVVVLETTVMQGRVGVLQLKCAAGTGCGIADEDTVSESRVGVPVLDRSEACIAVGEDDVLEDRAAGDGVEGPDDPSLVLAVQDGDEGPG